MTDKRTYETFITPAGEAVFPWLTKADTQHDSDGIYHVDVSVPFEQAADFIAKLEKIRDEFIATLPVAKQKSLAARAVYIDELTRPTYPEGATDEEKASIRANWEGEPTGNVIFRCKMKAKFRNAEGETFEQEPIVVMADTGERVTDPVYSGSVVRIKGQVVPYTNAASGIAGVTLRMKAAQVIELVSGGGSGGFWTDFEAA
jgi:hypothetical protein